MMPLRIDSFRVIGDQTAFAVSNMASLPFTIAPGESLALQVTFSAASVGLQSADLLIASNDPDSPQTAVHLVGTGLNPNGNPTAFTGAYIGVQTQSGVVLHDRLNASGMFQFILPPNQDFAMVLFDPKSGLVSHANLHTGVTGSRLDMGMLFFRPSTDPDTDGDGMPDDAEFAVGTDAKKADTDGDGIADYDEIKQNLDPLDNRGFPTGVIATLPVSGPAREVAVEGQYAYVATGSEPSANGSRINHGLSIVDVSRFNKPILLSEVKIPGDATDVALDTRLNRAVVAMGSTVEIIDVTDPKRPVRLKSIPVAGTRVEVRNSVAYVAAGRSLVSLDVVTGAVLQTMDVSPVGTTITDIVSEGTTLSTMDSGRTLRTFDIGSFPMTARGSLGLDRGGGKLFAGDGIAYVPATSDPATGGFSTVDVSNPDQPRLISGPDVRDRTPSSDFAANGSGLGLLVGDVPPSGPIPAVPRLIAEDIRDPSNTDSPVFLIDMDWAPRAVTIASGIGFLAAGPPSGFVGNGLLRVVNYLPFDNLGRAPTAQVTTSAPDYDPATPGHQVPAGLSIPIQARVGDDVQVRDVELLVNGRVVQDSVSFPWNFSAVALGATPSSRTATIQVRATDTGGNVTLSDPLTLELLGDLLPPSLLASSPADGSANPLGLQQVTLDFSEPMDPTTLSRSTLHLFDRDGLEITIADIASRFDDQHVQLTFAPLSHGVHRLVIDAAAVTDRAGNPPGTTPLTIRLAVGDVTPPSVKGVFPPNGGAAEKGLTTLGVAFSEAIATPSRPDVFRLLDSSGRPISPLGVVWASSTSAQLTVPPLPVDSYRLTIDAGSVFDLVGNPLGSAPFDSTFRVIDTIRPTVLSIDARSGAGVPVGQAIVSIQFSEPLAPATVVTSSFQVLGPGGVAVEILGIGLDADASRVDLSFAPQGAVVYQLRLVASAITDPWGNPLGTTPIVVPFTVFTGLVVTNTNDSGPGSLRAAIEEANRATVPFSIVFAIPGDDPGFVDIDGTAPGGDAAPDVFVIAPRSALPPLNNPNAAIVLDGRTQSAFGGDTNPLGPEIVLDGSLAGANVDGLTILSSDNVVAGLDVRAFAGAGLVISGGSRNVIAGNFIGTDAAGKTAMGNGGDGIRLGDGARSNRIGSDFNGVDDAEEANVIAFNGGSGVVIAGDTSRTNSLRRNSIHSNAVDPQIDLGADGFDSNDPLDADSGPNDRQNAPVVFFGILDNGPLGSFVRLAGRMQGAPNTTYRLDFYRDSADQASSKVWFATTTVTTDGTGRVDFNPLIQASLVVDDVITATATDPDGNTSEYGIEGNAINPGELEPNDTLATAAPTNLSHATPGEYAQGGTIGNRDASSASGLDVDMLRVQLNAGDRLTVDIDSSGPAAADTVLRLFDDLGLQLARSDAAAGPGEPVGIDPYLDFVATTTGTFYLAISGQGNASYHPLSAGNGNPGAFGFYDFKVTVFTPTETSRNDTRAQAVDTGLAAGRAGTYTTVAAIGDVPAGNPSLDVDLYRMSLGAGDRVTIDIDAAGLIPRSTLNSYLRVFDASGNPLPFQFNDDAPAPGEGATTDSYLSFTAPSPGVYYVGVSGAFNVSYLPDVASSVAEGSTGTYQLEIRVTPPPGIQIEPNDSPSQASDTGLHGQPGTYLTTGRISSPFEIGFRLDTDVFRLDLLPGQTVTVLITPLGPLQPRLLLQNASGVTLAQSFGLPLTYLATGSGTFYVFLSSANPFSSFGDYTLQITVQ